jgi:hypothetical protein
MESKLSVAVTLIHNRLALRRTIYECSFECHRMMNT